MAFDCRARQHSDSRQNRASRRSRRGQVGVSLIEQVMAVAVVGTVVGLGMPNVSEYIQNRHIRTQTESIASGLAFARAESVRRNELVDFRATGANWSVVVQSDGTILTARSGAETARAAVTVNGTAPAGLAITFNGTGRIVSGNAGTVFNVDHSSGSCLPSGTYRCLRVMMNSGGQVRSCDPQAPSAAPQSCAAVFAGVPAPTP
jgi:type IV fimbrial biogenesis protein FimT